MGRKDVPQFRVAIVDDESRMIALSNRVDFLNASVGCQLIRADRHRARILVDKRKYGPLIDWRLVAPLWICVEVSSLGTRTMVRSALGSWIKCWNSAELEPPTVELPAKRSAIRKTWGERALDRMRAFALSLLGMC